MKSLSTLIRSSLIAAVRHRRRKQNKENALGQLVILAYHRVGSGTDVFMDIPLSSFEAQLDYLQDNFEIMSLDQAVDIALTTGIKDNTAVLTFDDGYCDFYTNALPVLDKRGLPATLYIATHFIENQENFPWDVQYVEQYWPDVRPLTWDQLREIAELNLIGVGSHTHTHARIDRLSRNNLEREITTSIGLIQSALGFKPKHFACPKGIFSRQLLEIAPEYFHTVVVGGWRPNSFKFINFHYLQRIPALQTSDISLFAQSLTGDFAFLDTLATVRYKLFWRR